MDSHSLQAFVTVADCASFSKAAEQLHLTQPAISKRIANLEQQLACRLFDRIGRQVSLTEAGQALLPRATTILDGIEDSRRALSHLNHHVSGRLTLATSHHISLHRLPAVLRSFRSLYPDAELAINFTESERAYEAVLQGNAELAVITLAPDPHPMIQSTRVWTDTLRFVVAKEHPLATSPHPQLQQLTQYPAILPAPTTFTRQIVEQRFKAADLQLAVGMSTNALDTIRMMVRIGFGWSLLPTTMIDDTLHQLPIKAPPLTRSLGYIRHQGRTQSKAAQAFIHLLEQQSDHPEVGEQHADR